MLPIVIHPDGRQDGRQDAMVTRAVMTAVRMSKGEGQLLCLAGPLRPRFRVTQVAGGVFADKEIRNGQMPNTNASLGRLRFQLLCCF